MKTKIFPLSEETKMFTRCLINAKAIVETIHPIVTGYQKAILKELNAKNKITGEPITNPNNTYLIDESLFKIYLKRCDEEAAKNKLEHEPNCCPLLTAESLEREAKRAFGEHILPLLPDFENMKFDDLLRFSKDKDGNDKRDNLGRLMFISDEIIELSLKLIVPNMTKEELTIK